MRARTRRIATVAFAVMTALALLAGVAEAKKQKRGVPVKVMTRNLFLGADLSPGLNAASFQDFIEANGQILREVDLTNFPTRAQGLAREIAAKKPDFVGLQEVAWWRTADPYIGYAQGPNGNFTATTTKYDFLALLQAQLKARGMNYRVAVEKPEFDFEAPTDYNDVDNDAPPGMGGGDATNDESANSFDDAEITGRLTMRDVILVRAKRSIKFKNPISGTYSALFTPNISGVQVPVTRGWTALDATVTKGKGKKKVQRKFRFVNTHFEAFDDETEHPSIRARQAMEVTAGPAAKGRTIILGDFNSDDDTVAPDDQQAYRALLAAGFRERSTANPLSCCVSNLLTSPPTEFDHQIDHVMTNMGKKAKLVNSSVTGRNQLNGIYDSDHAGVFSTLKLK